MAADLYAFNTKTSGNRGRNYDLSLKIRSLIITTLLKGKTRKEILGIFYIYRDTVCNILKRFKDYFILDSLPRKGRPKKLGAYEKRAFGRVVKMQLRITWRELKS